MAWETMHQSFGLQEGRDIGEEESCIACSLATGNSQCNTSFSQYFVGHLESK
jgi:hypothetical protein